MLSPPEMSSEFLALCDFQLALLSQSFNASQTVIYLTTNSTQLVPVVVYPNSDNLLLESSPPLLNGIDIQDSQTDIVRLVLPLIYDEMVMGLLVTGREKKEWSETELTQIEKITQTIAIACLLEKRQAWYQQNIIDIQQMRLVEQEKLSNLLHQLRNPLTALRTFSKLLFKRLFGQEDNQKIVTGLLRETEHLQDLLQQFETKTLEPQNSTLLLPAALEIKDILATVVNSVQAVAENNNIELITELEETFPRVQGNPQALREVIQNILDNAIKYTPPGGKVKINTLTKPGWGGIAIHDTGYGIPPEVQERIFERHYRGIQAEGDIPGTGLGLAIAKNLITEMGGNIELISPNQDYFDVKPRGEGTTFIIWLPLKP
ncbi:MAG: GAF domain-containing sensor histidine kinase [Gloeocapsa sp. DLM2.Bin57]|nr:MAG: GAF domain-containing sensor histidine kinase [Gloeocapsa sp. DLM2.Bin57]